MPFAYDSVIRGTLRRNACLYGWFSCRRRGLSTGVLVLLVWRFMGWETIHSGDCISHCWLTRPVSKLSAAGFIVAGTGSGCMPKQQGIWQCWKRKSQPGNPFCSLLPFVEKNNWTEWLALLRMFVTVASFNTTMRFLGQILEAARFLPSPFLSFSGVSRTIEDL